MPRDDWNNFHSEAVLLLIYTPLWAEQVATPLEGVAL